MEVKIYQAKQIKEQTLDLIEQNNKAFRAEDSTVYVASQIQAAMWEMGSCITLFLPTDDKIFNVLRNAGYEITKLEDFSAGMYLYKISWYNA